MKQITSTRYSIADDQLDELLAEAVTGLLGLMVFVGLVVVMFSL